MTLQRVNSPNFSNSLLSQSSSTFHEREPTKRFLLFSPSPDSSFLAFLATGEAGPSALRFLDSSLALGFSSSLSLSEVSSESESESLTEESDSEAYTY
jgi:hypothetical protein